MQGQRKYQEGISIVHLHRANLVLIQKSASGIPLGQNEKTVEQAQSENQIYKSTIDDPMQIAIDAATNEAEILGALGLWVLIYSS